MFATFLTAPLHGTEMGYRQIQATKFPHENEGISPFPAKRCIVSTGGARTDIII
ncbi:hypothetical protein M404DRAFT_994448 [Pisolithus tinctorius Marx 270]|uniref:Uncharacterized protein n=1 Tax=Pisolithus tinctorius Marx 270 TaxID=870435 RepID=A0A0C3KQA2_PISTI|nr:hypothetical protein M404DRAFT_994448 [Pisolithus tinctorius Marx 270]